MHSMWRRKNQEDSTNEINTESASNNFSIEHDKISLFLDELHNIQQQKTTTTPNTETNTVPKKKHHPRLRKNTHGKPVYLQDNGNQIATVIDEIHDIKNKLQAYTIQDTETQQIYQIPAIHFDHQTNGLIYIPSWYTKGKTLVDHLEFTDRINPVLKLLITDETTQPQDLHETFIKDDHELQQYLQQTQTTHKMLTTRLTLLQKERTTIKQYIFDLIEQRLIKDIPRKEFADNIQQHRQKATLLDLQITRCQNLIKQLNNTSLGLYLQKTQPTTQQPQPINNQTHEYNSLQKKYTQLKHQYQEIQEKYTHLKESIEKLLEKELL